MSMDVSMATLLMLKRVSDDTWQQLVFLVKGLLFSSSSARHLYCVLCALMSQP